MSRAETPARAAERALDNLRMFDLAEKVQRITGGGLTERMVGAFSDYHSGWRLRIEGQTPAIIIEFRADRADREPR